MSAEQDELLLKRDEIINKFLQEETLLGFKKNQFLKLIQLGQTRALTGAENNQLHKLRAEFKDALPSDSAISNSTDIPASGEVLPTPQAVTKYLQKKGWKVKKSTVYNHVKAGFLYPLPSGGYTSAQVDTYAAAKLRPSGFFLSPVPASTMPIPNSPSPQDPLQRERLEEEVGKLRAQREHWQKRNLDIDARIKDLVGQELASRARFFRSDIENFFRGEAGTLIALVDGDPAKAPDLIDLELSRLEMWLARFSEDRQFETAMPIIENNIHTPEETV